MLLATFHLDHRAVALTRAFEEVPGMEVEAKRIAAHSTEWTMPCMWVAHDDFDKVDAAFRADPSVATIVETDEFESEKYYHVDWADEVEKRVNAYIDKEGSIMRAKATDAGWRLQLRFVHREQFDIFREYLSAHGYTFRLQNIIEPGTPRQSSGDLTPDQRDALVAALDAGYYDIPRDATGKDLAEQLGMSPQALSELLRRGTANLIDAMLTTPTETESDGDNAETAE